MEGLKMHVKKIQGGLFEETVLRAPTPVVVDFYAPWCGGCNVFEPVFERTAIRWDKKLLFAKYNVDNNDPAVINLNIMRIPTVILFNNGKEVARYNDVMTSRALDQFLFDNL